MGFHLASPKNLPITPHFQPRYPKTHKSFLQELEWAVDLPTSFPPGRVTAVHAGFNTTQPLTLQIAQLLARNFDAPALIADNDISRSIAFHGRQLARPMHPELDGKAILVSGHHSIYYSLGDRYIIDASGGTPSATRPLQALVLPERIIINHTD